MNCPKCNRGLTFMGDWENAMRYRCEDCKYDISMKKIKHSHDFKCACGQKINCETCGKKMNRWKSHGTLKHTECGHNEYYGIRNEA